MNNALAFLQQGPPYGTSAAQVTDHYDRRVKVVDLELSKPLRDLAGLGGYVALKGLLRWHGYPIGYIDVPVCGAVCTAEAMATAVREQQANTVLKAALRAAIGGQHPPELTDARALLGFEPPVMPAPAVSLSVAVCTRDRSEDLALCLESLRRLTLPPLEILVIDNAPSTDATRRLVAERFAEVRYIEEPRPGLNWARNRAIGEARGEILAYTDDDVIVDPRWTQALARLFEDNPVLMAATGLVAPFEIETAAQAMFETYGGFGRGFERKWYQVGARDRGRVAGLHAGSGKFGTGANMAYRRSVFAEIGWFDPALDVGTVTNGGGDLDMFFRVLKHGHALVYEPGALAWHRHRRGGDKLRSQIANNGIGFFSYLMRNALAYPEERRGLIRMALWWLRVQNFQPWLRSKFKPTAIDKELIAAEFAGSIVGFTRYQKARRVANRLEKEHGAPCYANAPTIEELPAKPASGSGIAVRTVDVLSELPALEDIEGYRSVRIFVLRGGESLGEFTIANWGRSITRDQLLDAIANFVGLGLFLPAGFDRWAPLPPSYEVKLGRFLGIPEPPSAQRLPDNVPVSVVIATCDRPEALRECLASLFDQKTQRAFEIVVVDNRPSSGLTPPVVAEFPKVKLVAEPRPGLSFARNAGFAAASGEILVCTDDDVTFPPTWLEELVSPFVRNDVTLVTGNVFPARLQNASEIQFEAYGGLGRGFVRREYDRAWFDSFRRRPVPTWLIGASANAAVRASALRDPKIGLLDEALGAGTPAGCSEDTYLFYKILKAGHVIVYEPRSYVWHKHRATEKDLRKQISSYAKGHAAYHLSTWQYDGDGRALYRVFVEIPKYQVMQILRWARGDRRRTLDTILLEVWGNIVGPLALFKSRRRARRLGPGPRFLDSSAATSTSEIPSE